MGDFQQPALVWHLISSSRRLTLNWGTYVLLFRFSEQIFSGHWWLVSVTGCLPWKENQKWLFNLYCPCTDTLGNLAFQYLFWVTLSAHTKTQLSTQGPRASSLEKLQLVCYHSCQGAGKWREGYPSSAQLKMFFFYFSGSACGEELCPRRASQGAKNLAEGCLCKQEASGSVRDAYLLPFSHP